MSVYHIHVDGSNSHPKGAGPAACGIVVLRKDGDKPGEVATRRKCFPSGTNNEMELNAILLGVEWANQYSGMHDEIVIISDSQWAAYTSAKALNLDYLTQYNTDKYPGLFQRIQILWEDDRMSLQWVPREKNHIADREAGEALKEAKDLFQT